MKGFRVSVMTFILVMMCSIPVYAAEPVSEEAPTNAEITVSNIVFGETIPETRKDKLIDAVLHMPEYIAKMFNDKGWHVELTEQDLAERFYAGRYRSNNVLASANGDTKTIYFDNRDKAVTYRNLSHELGHMFDEMCGWISDGDEWAELYWQEKDGFICTGEKDGHSKVSPCEYFAACFSEYFTNEEQFAESAPKSYSYMDNFVHSLPEKPSEESE